MGIARLNGWPDYIRSQLRYLGTIVSDEPNPDYRLFRIEVSPEVVGLIQQANGLIFIGRHRGTVRQGSRDLVPLLAAYLNSNSRRAPVTRHGFRRVRCH